jgi:hypothetical protein
MIFLLHLNGGISLDALSTSMIGHHLNLIQ